MVKKKYASKETLQNGAKMRDIRENIKGFSQNEMADYLEVTQATYSKIECGETSADLPTINKIAEKLNVKAKDLINEEAKQAIIMQTFQDQSLQNGTVNNNLADEKLVIKLTEVVERQSEMMQTQNKTVETLLGVVTILVEKLPK